MAADVYSMPPHVGRGGWTWYTGSAAWMYRAGLEGILGFRVQGASLLLDPCVPRAWPRFEIVFRYHSSRYEITVENPEAVSRGIARVEADGTLLVGTPPGSRSWMMVPFTRCALFSADGGAETGADGQPARGC